ncbi:hypothetical protein [Aureispira sp. CCB-QB1]|uniref:hypothetical protein n=1 Tax=Aureispira sp. CCB-QB1 TaxID=1313421 RepID=UPI000696A28F|nr:hypothetical protein [Aureispira sp. CCB-QB1]
MKIYYSILFIFFSYTLVAQFSVEAIVGTGLNMSIHRQYVSQEKPRPNFTAETHFPGGGLDIGFGARLGFDDRLSFGLGIEYQYKGHEGNYIKQAYINPENSKYWFHILVIPIDAQYTLPNNIGFHLGVELGNILGPWFNNGFLFYQNKVMVGALTGISYTKGRFRFELLYKHYFNYYMKQTIYIGSTASGFVEFSDYNRFHDIQLRVAFRLFRVN